MLTTQEKLARISQLFIEIEEMGEWPEAEPYFDGLATTGPYVRDVTTWLERIKNELQRKAGILP